MSQEQPPRKFKFVGGPSRKRRRCAPPRPTPTNDGQRLMQFDPESDAGHVAPIATSSNNDIGNVTMSVPTSFADSHQVPTASIPPPPSEALESLLDWPATDELGSSLEFNDAFSLFGAPFNLPNSLGDPEASLGNPEEYIPRDQGLSPIQDMPSEGSSNSTEDIERELEPETQDDRPIPRDISDNLTRLFAQYDREFCVWPLTHDFEANPFRYDIETGRGSPLLWHSILALSYKHIHRETGSYLAEAKVHKKKAVQLFEELEGDLESDQSRANLLNGLLILMTLDCATSAQGPWVSHLNRAQKIIEALELFKIQTTPRIQAQIDMLVWWDVTLGLTTRQGFVLSGPTMSSVFRSNGVSTFYNVSGCPDELFKYMVRLGMYAREFELASHMTCVTFNMEPVLAVERAIKEWRAPRYDDPDVDFTDPNTSGLPDDWCLDPIQTAHYVQDLYHCAQAWRFSLLVYIERVFKWRRGEASMGRISFFARKTLNNVLSCRRSAMIQKQLLLPVFLSASETDDENLRDGARSYCNWWGVKSRYDMFITTLGLLEDVWAAAADPNSWWGSLIDHKSGVGSTRQYLFG